MWRKFIQSLSGDCTFNLAAAPRAIAAAERDLKIGFPAELIELLYESNGVQGQYGLGLIWPVERILADNLSFRTEPHFRELYMPFDHLLFFGDAANGRPVCFLHSRGRHSPP